MVVCGKGEETEGEEGFVGEGSLSKPEAFLSTRAFGIVPGRARARKYHDWWDRNSPWIASDSPSLVYPRSPKFTRRPQWTEQRADFPCNPQRWALNTPSIPRIVWLFNGTCCDPILRPPPSRSRGLLLERFSCDSPLVKRSSPSEPSSETLEHFCSDSRLFKELERDPLGDSLQGYSSFYKILGSAYDSLINNLCYVYFSIFFSLSFINTYWNRWTLELKFFFRERKKVKI